MTKDRTKATEDSCEPLAQAVLAVRERGIVSERWIESALIAALDSHDWPGDRPGGLATVGRKVARLVHGKKSKDALAKELARITKQVQVRDRVLKFFRVSGLAETGVPVDHDDVGREQLMAAMLERFMYGSAHGYQTELDLQGAYTLLQSAGPAHVNRSFLLVKFIESSSVIWAVHLYRSGGAQTELKVRMGVFLPGTPNAALLSMARWSEPAPVIHRWLNEEDARATLSAVQSQRKQSVQGHSLAVLNFKPDNRAELMDEQGLKVIGIIPPELQPGPVTLEAIGLVSRSELSHLEASRTPQPNATHSQAYAEAQEALARFALIAGASRGSETLSASEWALTPEQAGAPADPDETAAAVNGGLSAELPGADDLAAEGAAAPAQIS